MSFNQHLQHLMPRPSFSQTNPTGLSDLASSSHPPNLPTLNLTQQASRLPLLSLRNLVAFEAAVSQKSDPNYDYAILFGDFQKKFKEITELYELQHSSYAAVDSPYEITTFKTALSKVRFDFDDCALSNNPQERLKRNVTANLTEILSISIRTQTGLNLHIIDFFAQQIFDYLENLDNKNPILSKKLEEMTDEQAKNYKRINNPEVHAIADILAGVNKFTQSLLCLRNLKKNWLQNKQDFAVPFLNLAGFERHVQKQQPSHAILERRTNLKQMQKERYHIHINILCTPEGHEQNREYGIEKMLKKHADELSFMLLQNLVAKNVLQRLKAHEEQKGRQFRI
jgi:hypothetical protein